MKIRMLGTLGCIIFLCFLTGSLCGAQEWEYEGQININSDDVVTIELLPGVDRETAENIVIFRESNGPFSTIDDLKMVIGVDDEVIEQIRPYATTGKGKDLQDLQ